MRIEIFNEKHVEAAIKLFLENYEEERNQVEALMAVNDLLDTRDYYYQAKNGMGVAALEGDRLVGFWTYFGPWNGMYDSFDGKGVFSPIHCHGAVKENRDRIYQDMYEALGNKLYEEDILGLGIALMAHDSLAKEGLFQYGFGMRCKDAIRLMETDKEIVNRELSFAELKLEEFTLLNEMRYELDQHLKQSPCFLQSTGEEFEDWLSKVNAGDRRTFAAKDGDEIVAYVDVAEDGENLVGDYDKMRNIQGAYCKPEMRGRGIYSDLLTYVIRVLKEEGFTHLGVDYESYNPTANRFWGKHFTEYTNSVVRRVENWSKGK